jgi:hypothetical protein
VLYSISSIIGSFLYFELSIEATYISEFEMTTFDLFGKERATTSVEN